MLPSPSSQPSDELRARVNDAREQMTQQLAGAAPAPGRLACAALSDTYDQIVVELWRRAVADVGGGAAGMAIVATGGWGRREVCPRSDIDFILLCSAAGNATARAVADKLLYPLWDAGIKVGHAVREPRAAARLARDDLATATALLDARFLTGNARVADDLARLTRQAIAPGGKANAFVSKLGDEKVRRHDKFGDSLYLLEPNLKQGIGTLRDLSTAVWAAKARWGVSQMHELITRGQVSSRQVSIIEDALDFLLKIRCLVQLMANRVTDQLTFEIQETIAPSLYPDAELAEGDVRPAVAPAVEALMRSFYLHARGVVQVADRLLELAWVPARRKPHIFRIDSSFITFNGKLAVKDPAIFREQPAEMFRIFRVALEHDVPIYGHTKELIADNAGAMSERITGDPECSRHFLAALTDPNDKAQPSLLEQMHQLGLLAAVMPEFGPCTCRVQHDLYHVYTVDQHQLYAVAMLKRIARGELAAEYPIATEAVATVQRPEALYLGTLLHDVGKPLGKGHAEKGARLTGIIGTRLGMSPEDVDTAQFLVRQHLTMAHLCQRRDLSDPEVIARFAERVEDEQRLVKLYLCTLCDTAMTAPGNLSAWKNELLRELYLRTRDHLRGAVTTEDGKLAEQVREARERVVDLVCRPGVPESPESLDAGAGAAAPDRASVEAFVAGIDERFFAALTPRQLARQVQLALVRQESKAPAEIAVACYPLKGYSELAVVADDVRGLLAKIAGALAANRIDVLGAVIGPRRAESPGSPQVALDIFYVRDLYGKAIPIEDPRWDGFRQDLAMLLTHDGAASEIIEALIARRRPRSGLAPVMPKVATLVPARIRIDNDASAEATVVEVFSRDAVGVLYAITHTLTEVGLDIHLSKVSTEGAQVADVFYVTCGEPRLKITDSETIELLEQRLLAALAAVYRE